jgi:hypothetical protein
MPLIFNKRSLPQNGSEHGFESLVLISPGRFHQIQPTPRSLPLVYHGCPLFFCLIVRNAQINLYYKRKVE